MNIKSKKTKAFNIVLGFFMVVITLITLYPVWFSVINSLNSASAIAKNGYAMVLTKFRNCKSLFYHISKNCSCNSRADRNYLYVCLWIF